MLTIAWKAASATMSGLDSAVTFAAVPDRAGTRLIIEHDGLHQCLYIIWHSAHGPYRGRPSIRRIGEVSATVSARRASIRRLSEALTDDAGNGAG